MFSWLRSKRRKKAREDQRYLEARARRLLQDYLAADDCQKKRYYEVIAGAAAACQSKVSDPSLEGTQLARSSAASAIRVVKSRDGLKTDRDNVAALITDAYATVAIAYHRAAAGYMVDEEMRKLGTAAVHLTTMAISYMAAKSRD